MKRYIILLITLLTFSVLFTNLTGLEAQETYVVNGIGRGINLQNAKTPMDFKEGSPILNEDYLRNL